VFLFSSFHLSLFKYIILVVSFYFYLAPVCHVALPDDVVPFIFIFLAKLYLLHLSFCATLYLLHLSSRRRCTFYIYLPDDVVLFFIYLPGNVVPFTFIFLATFCLLHLSFWQRCTFLYFSSCRRCTFLHLSSCRRCTFYMFLPVDFVPFACFILSTLFL
jgi:hypothetical protein